MPKGYFITGADTGVGKTIVAGALIRVMQVRGIQSCGMKPIETGCSRVGGGLFPSDGMFLKRVARMDEAINHITPYCFETPVAPLVASEIEGREIDVGVIRSEFGLLLEKYRTVVVEGIGGILVPIRRDYFVIDLIRELGLPLVVVSSPSLGTINHTLLTVNHALREGITVAGIIINFRKPPENTIAEQTNPAVLRKISPVPIIGTFPHIENLDDETLEKASLEYLNAETLIGR
ncbi:MAG TPA: dethiobiotin synthase [Thermodesulfovibrionales bacterium]|nr:dethiobiotin synthase [Thermodesulfovibrionales bacterium]